MCWRVLETVTNAKPAALLLDVAKPSLVDRGLLYSNLGLLGGAVLVACLAVAGVRPSGWLDAPVAFAIFAWLFATPLLAGFGAYRARASRLRRTLATHATLGAMWALGMAAALVLPMLSRGA